MKFAAGSVLAERYRLGSCLGRGGMGEVWSAVHLVTERHVAIKRLLLTGQQDRDRESRARFVREARTACAVDHPNVVEVLEFVEADGEPPILVMEQLCGQTLAQLLRRTPKLGVEQTARLLLPVISAVGTAHSLGIVHRDLKPANIYLHERTSGMLVKVLDFGLAKWVASLASPADPRTRDGTTLGTPCYMAPEQAAGQRPITHRVDIWALGAILYECLAGVRPIDGENFAEVVMKLRHATITPIEVLEPTLPGELSKLVGSMLSRDPTARPQDLREAVAVLSTYAKVSVPTFGPPDVDLVMATEALSRTRSVPPSARTQPGASGSTETAPVPTPNEVRAYRFRRGVTVAAVAAAVIGLLALVRSAH